jgi:predicted exporter
MRRCLDAPIAMIAARRGMPGMWLLPVMMLAAIVYLALRLRVDADFSAFLPQGLTEAQRVFVKQLREGVASRLLLIDIRGVDAADLGKISQSLAERLGRDPAFRTVRNGSDSFAAEWNVLQRYRYLLSDGVSAERFTSAGLRAALEERLEGLSGTASPLEKRLLAADPTGETLSVLQKLTPAKAPRKREGVWFNQAGDGALLLAETRAPGSDLQGQAAAIDALRHAFDEARGGRAVTLRFSSPGAMAVESRESIAADARRLSVISSTLILGLLAWFYRSLAVIALCALPAAIGLLIGVAAVNAWFGSVHAITLGFGVTLLGEAVDYPSYLFTQVRQSHDAAPALTRIAPTLRLAVLTTACGSLALLMSSFTGLAELGLLTIVGVIGAGIATVLLPRWIPSGWQGVATHRALERFAKPPPGSASRAGIAVAASVAAVALAASQPWWDDDLASMNPLPTQFRDQDRQLRQELGAADVRSFLTIGGNDREQVLSTAERLRPHLERWVAAGAISGFELVSDYLPSQATQKARQAALPPRDVLEANLAQGANGLPFKPETFTPFLDAVEEARQAPLVTAQALAGTAFGLKIESLLTSEGDRWLLVVPLAGVTDPGAVAAQARAVGLRGVQFVDLRAESIAMMREYRRHTLAYAALGAVLIFVVLAHGLKSPRRAGQTMLPVGVALIVTAATLVAARQPLSVFHLVSLLLVLGIGINYSLVYRRAIEHRDTYPRTLQTLALVSGTTLCAFGALAFSQTPVLHAIGVTASLGVITSLAATVLLLAPRREASPPFEGAG